VRKLEVRATGSKRSGRRWDFETGFPDAGEELGVCVAEEVNGLHGVADNETTAAFALRPGGDEAAEEFVLAAAGVLKLVDEDVVDAVGDGKSGVGGQAVGTLEDVRAIGRLRCSQRRRLQQRRRELGAALRSRVKQARTICQSSSV